MRIISGNHRGKWIKVPAGLPVRPTTDMAKEALFNILRNLIDFESAMVLDLFAGTGNLTYEFAARACPGVIAVDNNPSCIAFIRNTAEALGFKAIETVRADAFRYLMQSKKKFDLIFADPPYDLKEAAGIPGLVFQQSLLYQEGILVVEHDRKMKFGDLPQLFDHRQYGKVNFSFFRSGID